MLHFMVTLFKICFVQLATLIEFDATSFVTFKKFVEDIFVRILHLYSLFLACTNIWVPGNEFCIGISCISFRSSNAFIVLYSYHSHSQFGPSTSNTYTVLYVRKHHACVTPLRSLHIYVVSKVKIVYFCNLCTFVLQKQSSHNLYGISERDNISIRDPHQSSKIEYYQPQKRKPEMCCLRVRANLSMWVRIIYVHMVLR